MLLVDTLRGLSQANEKVVKECIGRLRGFVKENRLLLKEPFQELDRRREARLCLCALSPVPFPGSRIAA